MFKYKKGRAHWRAGNADLAFFIGFFLLLGILWWASGGASKNSSGEKKPLFNFAKISAPATASSNKSNTDTANNKTEADDFFGVGEIVSPWRGQVTIDSLGNAKKVYQPASEYIILKANRKNKDAINVSGWFLTNGKNRKIVPSYSAVPARGVSDRAYIPFGKNIYTASSVDVWLPIGLLPGERAVVNSGGLRNFKSHNIAGSFKTNICTGYLEKISRDVFTPALPTECPDPAAEPGLGNVDDECLDFIDDLDCCHTPEFDQYKTIRGRRERGNFVDGVEGLSKSCRLFLAEHYNYEGCLANHLTTDNFNSGEWRVYLGRHFEMWAAEREVVTLYDDLGRVVDQKTYK